MSRVPTPGEAPLRRILGRLIVVRNVTLAAEEGELMVDAILDTGSTYCVIPAHQAMRLGLDGNTRLGTRRAAGVGRGTVSMDHHRLAVVQAGTARAYNVDCLAGEMASQFMLLGMSFLEKFNTTLDFDQNRVAFHPRIADRERLSY